MADQEPFFLRNIWYHAAPLAMVPRGQLHSVTICGEPIVLVHPEQGEPYALRDICPHRGIPLSDGRLVAGGQVECCYHGWVFSRTGACTSIPSLTGHEGMEVGRVKVRHYPLAVRAGQMFVWLGDGEGDAGLLPDIPAKADPNLTETMNFPCSIDHAVIGLMDPAHGPFVHKSWWWRSARSIHEKAKAFGPGPYGFVMLRHRPSKNSKAYRLLGGTPETEIRFQLPGVRIEHITIGRHSVVNLTCVTPLDAGHTRITHSIYWTLPWLSVLRPLLRPYVRTFLGQDRDVVVRQQRGLAHNPGLMLIKDADTMARWYYQLKAEYQRAQQENRPFENPVREQVLRWRS